MPCNEPANHSVRESAALILDNNNNNNIYAALLMMRLFVAPKKNSPYCTCLSPSRCFTEHGTECRSRASQRL